MSENSYAPPSLTMGHLKGTATLMITMFYMKDLNKTMNFDTSFI